MAGGIPATRDYYAAWLCNITNCCTEVCPAGIKITDNTIVPMKERAVGPLRLLLHS